MAAVGIGAALAVPGCSSLRDAPLSVDAGTDLPATDGGEWGADSGTARDANVDAEGGDAP